MTFFLTSGLLQFTVTVLYLSFYYNILDVSVLTKFNKILLLFVTNKAVSGWSVSKEICHDEWIIPCNLLWRRAQSWSTPLFFDAINCISRYLQTNNWSGQPLVNMQQSTCCVLPSQRCLQGNENAITFWVNKVITFCVKYCYILSCTIKFCFKNSYIFASLLHFVASQRLAKKCVMECRKDAGSTVNPSAIGLPDQAFLSEVRIFYHLTPKMQSILYEAKKFKNQHHYQYC